jgi:hypothetical protein
MTLPVASTVITGYAEPDPYTPFVTPDAGNRDGSRVPVVRALAFDVIPPPRSAEMSFSLIVLILPVLSTVIVGMRVEDPYVPLTTPDVGNTAGFNVPVPVIADALIVSTVILDVVIRVTRPYVSTVITGMLLDAP